MQQVENSIQIASVRQKIASIESSCKAALQGVNLVVPQTPGRDVSVVAIRELPAKPGLSTLGGQARLLHDLASIELQAMELGLRTLIEFPQAPVAFRERLAEITVEEASHLASCIGALEELGHPWGTWPVHLGLWRSVDSKESLIDRVLIVHRYMEGSGLDAGETIRRRLSGVQAPLASEVSEKIAKDELEHVRFGSDWYRRLCRDSALNPDDDFAPRLQQLFHRLPRRLEPLAFEVRQQAGFSSQELQTLEGFRQSWLKSEKRIHQLRSHSQYGT